MNRILAGSLLAAAVLFITWAPSYGQPGRNPGGGGGGYDPKKMFESMAGKDTFVTIAKVNWPFHDSMVKFARDNNITNDRLTFDQFSKYWDERQKARAAEGGGYGKKGGGGGYGKKGGGGGGGFRNRDSSPKPAEPAPPVIAAKQAEKPANDPITKSRTMTEDELERRPVVYRPGNLPPGLPDWFMKLDKDKDGQVDLGEWRLAGKKISEFEEMDVNRDGLLTPEEVLLYIAQHPTVAAAPAPSTAGSDAKTDKMTTDSKEKEETKSPMN